MKNKGNLPEICLPDSKQRSTLGNILYISQARPQACWLLNKFYIYCITPCKNIDSNALDFGILGVYLLFLVSHECVI